MQGGKDLFLSKTTWGVLLLLARPVLGYFNLHFDDAAIDAIAGTFANGAGVLLTLWGQVTRKEPITSIAGVALDKSTSGMAPLLAIGLIPLLVAITFLSGCSFLQTGQLTTQKGDTATAQDIVNEANILLTAIYGQIADNVTAGVYSKQEAKDALAEADRYKDDVNTVKVLIADGKGGEAQQRARLVNTALLSLQKRVAEKARAGGS